MGSKAPQPPPSLLAFTPGNEPMSSPAPPPRNARWCASVVDAETGLADDIRRIVVESDLYDAANKDDPYAEQLVQSLVAMLKRRQ